MSLLFLGFYLKLSKVRYMVVMTNFAHVGVEPCYLGSLSGGISF
jgi:hypothetical protein